MIALLDVNVLIALVDSLHVHHAPATQFFRTAQREGWATCPLTENGLLRITERPTALHGPDSPAAARTEPLIAYGKRGFCTRDVRGFLD